MKNSFKKRVLGPAYYFHSDHYFRHNARRLEHLASLRIPVTGRTVLEVGAGIGDHSHYYTDRSCKVTMTEARPENLRWLKKRYPDHDVQLLDLEMPSPVPKSPFEHVHCYGTLYHLSNPLSALQFLGQSCSGMMFLETCVSFGSSSEINLVNERQSDPTQAFSGKGCRPTRRWIFETLQQLFTHVYIPKTQPNHEEFPLDWANPAKHHSILSRAVFIASRQPIQNDLLVPELIDVQVRHE